LAIRRRPARSSPSASRDPVPGPEEKEPEEKEPAEKELSVTAVGASS
jgi:hypothetical protein